MGETSVVVFGFFFVKNNNSSFIFALLSQFAEDTITDCRGHSVLSHLIYLLGWRFVTAHHLPLGQGGFTISSDGYVFNTGESFQDYS